MTYSTHSPFIQQKALQQLPHQAGACQQMQQYRFTNNLMVRVGLYLLAAVHVLLGSSCTTTPLQLGMNTEEHSTSSSQEEEVFDSDEESIAHIQVLKNEIHANTEKISDAGHQIGYIHREHGGKP